MGMEIFSQDLGASLTLLNICGPYQDRVQVWYNLFKRSLLQNREIVLGGDLNFYLGVVEMWGMKATPNTLKNYFIHHLE